MTGPFSTWAAAGFTSELLPIIPPDARLRAESSLELDDRGKTPGVVYAGGEWSGMPKWADLVADDGKVTYWDGLAAKYGCGVGLQGRQFPAADIDVLEPQVAAQMAALAEQYLGPAPERVGRPPKCLRPYSLAPGAEPIHKRRVAFTLPGDETVHAVEVLGHGQQYVVEGIHPGTGNPYAWNGGSPATLGAAGLTPITAAQVDQYMEAVAQAVAALGGAIVEKRAQADDAGNVDQEALKTDPKRLGEALDAMGNTIQSYDEWIIMCAAIKAALGGDEALYPIFEGWNLKDGRNTPELVRQKWDSLQPPYKVGADYVYRKAADAGWAGYAASVFTRLDDQELDDSDLPDYLKDWVYVVDQERFVRLADKVMLQERQFARLMSGPGISPMAKNNPAQLYFQHPRRRMLDTLTYVPGAPDLVRVDGKSAVNVWTPAPAVEAAQTRMFTVTDQDVRPWLDHMERLVPDVRVRNLFLDWMAYVIQHPDEKPNWALFLGGKQGIGKDLAFLPLAHGVGERNTRTVAPSELASEYTDWVSFRRLVVVEEMRNFETKSVMNKLKMYITRPPKMVPVHQKYMVTFEVPNVACFVFMSNFKDALSLEKGDRRYLVYWSPMEPEPEPYYVALASFLEGPGLDDVVAWLLARDVRAFLAVAKSRAPETADKAAMEEAGRGDFEHAVVEAIEAGAAPFDGDVVTLEVLWAALSPDMKRLQGAGMKRLGQAIQLAGGGPLLGKDGKARKVRLDAAGQPPRYGRPRVWALRDLEAYSAKADDELRRTFRGRWVADAMDAAQDASDDAQGAAEAALEAALPDSLKGVL